MVEPRDYTIHRDGPQSGSKGGRPLLNTIKATDLVALDLPPVRYLVEGYLAEGLTVLAGRPKSGKSWLALGLALAIASNGNAFGSIPCEQGDVLYLALEDNRRRLQRRLKQMCPYGDVPSRLMLATACPKLDEGGDDAICEWIASAADPRLVIVDVYAKIRPQTRATDTLYESDYRGLERPKKIADEHGLAVLALHHTRKMAADDPFDTVSGSTGLTGAADTVLVLTRDSRGSVLYGRGRDIEEIETALAFDPILGAWSILGAASEVRRSDERSTIIWVLKEAGAPMSPLAIAEEAGMRRENVKALLPKMVIDGQVMRITGRRGLYAHLGWSGVTPDYHDYRDYQGQKDQENGDD